MSKGKINKDGKTIKVEFNFSGGFNVKHITNGMNAKKVYEAGKNRYTVDSRITTNTRISNEEVISNYLSNTTLNYINIGGNQSLAGSDQQKIYVNNNGDFTIHIPISENQAMTYFHNKGGEVKACNQITIKGKIFQGNEYSIDHIHSSRVTGDILYSDVIKEQEEQRERQALEQQRKEQTTEEQERRNQARAEEAQANINSIDEEGIQEIMNQDNISYEQARRQYFGEDSE